LNDLKRMPVAVQKAIGTALRDLQFGARPRGIKRLTGLGGGVLEIVDDFDRSRIAPCSRSSSRTRSTCFTSFRRNRNGDWQLRGRMSRRLCDD